MGREMAITPVIWKQGDWPSFAPVRRIQKGCYLPTSNNIPSDEPFANDPEIIDFEPNSTIPHNFAFWRWPNKDSFTISPAAHPRTLMLTPSTASITSGYKNYSQYSVDVSFAPRTQDEEVGITVFLNQVLNINLGIAMLPVNATNGTGLSLALHFRFLVSGLGSDEKNIPTPFVTPVPHSWLQDPVRLVIRAENEAHYAFFAASSSRPWNILRLGQAPATIVSGGAGPFTGSLVGVYATGTNRKGGTESYISRWRYQGLTQEIGNGDLVHS